MPKQVFRFKQFDCSHGEGSMKIGVDAVLLAAWATVPTGGKILDVGTGCGVIALICAQRSLTARISGIDVHEPSVREAQENFSASPWHDRLSASLSDFNDVDLGSLDLIISNPPFFESGITDPDTPRLKARHQDALSPSVILRRGSKMLTPDGRIALISPACSFDELVNVGAANGLTLSRACYVKGNPTAPVKRVMTEFVLNADNGPCVIPGPIPTLVLEERPGIPTSEHLALCHDLYLKF